MPIKRLNYTGRKKILRDDAKFFLRNEADGSIVFEAAINLAQYELPETAQVFVEAYRQTASFMRFEYGTVSNPKPITNQLPYRLTEFAAKDGLLFRIKVVSIGREAGLLLAEGDSIPISEG